MQHRDCRWWMAVTTVCIIVACGDSEAVPTPKDTPQPPTDTAQPPTDTGQPPTDTAQPPTDTAQPPTDTAQPPRDLTTPPADTAMAEPASVQAAATYEVAVTSQVVYAQGMTNSGWGANDGTPMDLILDVYEPVGAPATGKPVLFIVHGGGFKGGSPTQGQLVQWANYFTERGFVSFSIDYRVAKYYGTIPGNWPTESNGVQPGMSQDQVNALYTSGRDTKAALRWVRAHADQYGIHKEAIGAMGGSAGAFLVLMLGVSNEEDYGMELTEAEDPTLSGLHMDESSRVAAVVDLWGGTGLLDALELLDGVDRFDANDAPIAIIHGTQDTSVPFAEAEQIKAKYDATGVPYAYHPLDAGHGAWGEKIDGKKLHEYGFGFVVEHLKLTVVP